MSSCTGIPEISSSEMGMVQPVTRNTDYSSDVLVDGRQKFSTAALLLMQPVLSGEAPPVRTGGATGTIFRPPDKAQGAFRSRESDLQEWENEGGATKGAPMRPAA